MVCSACSCVDCAKWMFQGIKWGQGLHRLKSYCPHIWSCVTTSHQPSIALPRCNRRYQLKLRRSESPMCRCSSRFSHWKDPPKRLMVLSAREVGSFQIRAQKCSIPYSYPALPMHCAQLPFFFVQRSRPVLRKVLTSVFLWRRSTYPISFSQA